MEAASVVVLVDVMSLEIGCPRHIYANVGAPTFSSLVNVTHNATRTPIILPYITIRLRLEPCIFGKRAADLPGLSKFGTLAQVKCSYKCPGKWARREELSSGPDGKQF